MDNLVALWRCPKGRNYMTVFGEAYLRENDAVLAAVRCSREQPGGNFAVRYDCVEALYRVVRLLD